ncbi:MAG: hypothetical protein IPI63_08040 [Methanothrix sp.]|jgi:hypothetical protein|uniref:hypothetical protein n=1 Tax=Methanothrix sp. TaxID=90426 RepID=UPI001BD52128|nr:hypothetical protein [Methanothrix sp.]MBK7386670.1 hypothetical protein [Methanothrix sp.]HPW73585.1 hypothetical protein [Methanothrix sp.]
MRSRLNVLLALFILAATAAMSMPPVSAQDESSSAGMIDQPVLKIMQAQDAGDPDEGATEKRIWNTFVENFDYQWEIWNATVHGNGSNQSIREAMIATTALLVLNSHGLAEAESTVPSEKFEDFHNYTVSSMKYFNIYLYNMAKYFETRKTKYSTAATDALNNSIKYYDLGKTEAEFLF